jgi:tetratricopeptide (TPR) repeat protein
MKKKLILFILIIGTLSTGCSTQNDMDKMLSSPEVERKAKAALLVDNGIEKAKSGDKKGSIADFDQAIILDPKFSTAYLNRGSVKSDLGDIKGAINDYDQAIIINPQYAQAYANRGFAKAQLRDMQGTLADFKIAAPLFQQQGNK